MAENGLDGTEKVIGFAFDGTGYGDDGAIWGGEVLLADYRGFVRAAHLKYFPLAGGDVSVKKPYRVALAHLWQAGFDEFINIKRQDYIRTECGYHKQCLIGKGSLDSIAELAKAGRDGWRRVPAQSEDDS